MDRLSAQLAGSVVVVGLAVAGALIWGQGWFNASDDPYAQCRETAVAGGTGAIGGPFTLTSETGERVSETDVITGLTMVYFGYTYCPDFCPTDLMRNAEAHRVLENDGVEISTVFITFDPERDTPEQMDAFTDFMHPDMLGLTGSAEDIETAKSAYRVYAVRADDDPTDYLMDHTTFTYLMHPEAGFLDLFRSESRPEEVANRTACFANHL